MTQNRKRYDKQFKIAAAQVVLGGEMRVVDLAKELDIKDSTLRRWAQEHEEMDEAAFPGNGIPLCRLLFDYMQASPTRQAYQTSHPQGYSLFA